MRYIKTSLLGSAALFAVVGTVHAADLPVKTAAPIEYVRVCNTYGTGFFYIPGTDTCLRLSGRARFEAGYQPSYTRQYGVLYGGDTSGYQGRLRINMDARTQTAYGTLRAFTRLEMASRTGVTMPSGTQQRAGLAYPALGVDQFGRDQQTAYVDKAFIQFAGMTAGRASSFYDFYAHDFELTGATAGSDAYSTNVLAYTAALENGFSITGSLEDPIYRRSPIYSPTNNPANVLVNSSIANFAQTVSPAPVVIGYIEGTPTRYSFVDVIERTRMPDFVGALRVDQSWGAAQLSAAVHELNIGNVANGAGTGTGPNISIPHTNNVYGWAVQGGMKINAPFVAAGDAFYIQASYGKGAQMYTGYCNYTGCLTQSTQTIEGQKFNQYFSDATVNPFTGQMQTSTSFTAVASYLHYWTPDWRSAFFGSYGEQSFSAASRFAQGQVFSLINPNGTNTFGSNGVGTPGTRFYNISQALRDTYQFVAGGSIIWSPVKDLDIGVEAYYTQIGLKSGRAIDIDKSPTAYANVAGINSGTFAVRTASQDSVSQVRFRVQRDF